MMGLSSPEWSRYTSELGVAGAPEDISAAVVRRMLQHCGERLPLELTPEAAAGG